MKQLDIDKVEYIDCLAETLAEKYNIDINKAHDIIKISKYNLTVNSFNEENMQFAWHFDINNVADNIWNNLKHLP